MKVLLLAHDFPPNTTVAAMRVVSWLKYSKNIEYTVITRNWSKDLKSTEQYYENSSLVLEKDELHGHVVHRIPFQVSFFDKINAFTTKKRWFGIRKIATFISQLLMWHRAFNYELGFLYHYADQYLKEYAGEYDAILVSGEPFILFKYAHQLSLKYGIKWVADYRDSWSQNPSIDQSVLQRFLINYRRRFEEKFIASSVAVTAPAKAILTHTSSNNTELIENGVDLELFNSIVGEKRDVFSLLLSGTVYEGHDAPAFLAGCIRFYKELQPKDFEVSFMGINYRSNSTVVYINDMAKKYPFIKILPRVSQAEAIRAQKSSYILFKFCFQKPVDGFYGARLYEYVSTGRLVLSIADHPDKKETDFFPNVHTVLSGEEDVYNYLKEKYAAYKVGTRGMNLMSEEDKYSISREFNTEKLEKLLIRVGGVE